MSADNAMFVISNGREWRVQEGQMSEPEGGMDDYVHHLWQRGRAFMSRTEAILWAHDHQPEICEYGVVEFSLPEGAAATPPLNLSPTSGKLTDLAARRSPQERLRGIASDAPTPAGGVDWPALCEAADARAEQAEQQVRELREALTRVLEHHEVWCRGGTSCPAASVTSARSLLTADHTAGPTIADVIAVEAAIRRQYNLP